MQHPRTYLRHRLVMFRTLLGIGSREVVHPYHWQIDANDLGVVLHRSRLNVAVMEVLGKIRDTLLFRAWLYLSVLVTLCGGAIARRRATPATLALTASAVCYVVPYFFVSPVADFRYVWWPVLATLMLPFTLRPEAYRASPPRDPEGTPSRIS